MSPIVRDLSVVENRPATVGQQFMERVSASGDHEAFRYPVGEQWESVSWKEAGARVTRLAAGLVAAGIDPQQRVGIASGTRYEWILADLAVMCAGAATTTVYPSTMADDVAYILADSECRLVFAEDDSQVAKLKEKRGELPQLHKVVTFDGTADGDWVIGLDDLEKLGEELLNENGSVVEERISATDGDSLATLIYTSGTTGRPKGVRLRHSSWTYEGAAIEAQKILSQDDLQYLWLPMAHSFGKVLLSTQLAIGFATAVDGRVDKIIENLAVVQPTFMGAAPRIFEKAHGRITTMQKQEGGVKERIFNAAFSVGLKVDQLKREGKSVPPHLKVLHGLFDKLVFSKIRERFGGRVRFFISGAAALNRDVAQWFHAAGILILEGYGMTESSAGSTVNHPEDYKFGTVGIPLPGTEVKIAEDGEILIKGPGVMEGYHNMSEATDETVTDGWLHTGDIGEFDGEAPAHHRPQEGPVQDVGRQVHRPVRDRVPVQGDLPARQPVPGARQRAQLLRRARRPRPGRHGGLGEAPRPGRQVVRGDGEGARDREARSRTASSSSTSASTAGSRSRSGSSSTTTSPWSPVS